MKSIEHICESGIALELASGKLDEKDLKIILHYVLQKSYSLNPKKIANHRDFFKKVRVTYCGANTPLYSTIPLGYCEECFKPKLGCYVYIPKINYKMLAQELKQYNMKIA